MTTTANKVATAISSSTALVSLASAKRAVKKATIAKRANPSTIAELKSFDTLDNKVIFAEGKASVAKAKLVAFLNKLLLNMDYATFCATQTVIKEHHMSNAGVSIDTTNSWWNKLGLSAKKPASPNASAVKLAEKRGAKTPTKGAPFKKDGRVTPLSTKLNEIKKLMTSKAHKEVYSVKFGTMLNLLIAESITCEKVEKAVK